MKVLSLIFLMLFGIVVFFGSSSALASERGNLVKNGYIKVETVGLKSRSISNVKVYQKDHMFVIYGKVNHRNKLMLSSGHVDIVLTDNDGNIITETYLPYLSSKKFKNRKWNFHSKLHITPPKGSILRITISD